LLAVVAFGVHDQRGNQQRLLHHLAKHVHSLEYRFSACGRKRLMQRVCLNRQRRCYSSQSIGRPDNSPTSKRLSQSVCGST
jgi:hypothetical protein